MQFNAKEGLASKPLELMHIDLYGPVRKNSPLGEQYYIYILMTSLECVGLGYWNIKMKHLKKFKILKALVENELDLKIKFLRSDQGGEYISDELFYFCEQHGIKW